MSAEAWSREALEGLERTLTRDELIHDNALHCREIITLLKAEREDAQRFAQYPNEEQTLIIGLIDRFDGFC